MGHGINRREDNVLDTSFRLRFVERLYDGAPRWWSDEWVKHTSRPQGKYGDRLDREPGVRELIAQAFDFRKFFNWNVPALVTCANPECPLRSWFMVEKVTTGARSFQIKKWEVINESQAIVGFEGEYTSEDREQLNHAQPLMANGRIGDLRSSCPQCGHKRPLFRVSDIKGKWVYVLKESGASLTPHLEIELKDSVSGSIHAQFVNGRFTDKAQAFDGGLALGKIKDHAWHFFLSPVRLGPKALALLSEAPKRDPNYASGRDKAKPADWKVGVNAELQPWTTTVKRRFQPRQLKTPYEFVALVDAVSWVAQIAEFDYYPIAAAQQKLVQDPDEQAKSFIAATLAQAIGRQQVSQNPPKFVEDQWDIEDDTVETPEEFRPKNVAQAWVDRYQAALEFLAKETNYACSRMFFPVRFSLGHRVIEQACQENTTDPNFLAFGLMHWAHILKEMLICQAGEAFTAWLANNREAAERIPQKNVLGGEGLEPGSKLGAAIGHGLPVHVLAYLSPVIIAGSDKPAEDLVKHLAKIDVQATTLGLSDLQAARNLLLDFGGTLVDHYIKKLPEELDPSEFHKASGLHGWKERMQSFSSIREVEKILSLLSAIADYSKKNTRYQTEWDRYGHAKNKVETPLKVVEFLTEKTHKLIKAGIDAETTDVDLLFEKELAEKIEKHGVRSLSAMELEIVSASRSLGAFRLVGLGVRLLAGPVGLVLGGWELVIQLGESRHAMESGDPGAAVAHGIQAVAGVLIVAIAGAECVALVTGAGAVAWAGPVGLIAAFLMLVGAVVMARCARNDLELFARHCFLGEDWGEGGSETTGKAWMATLGWAALKSHRKARLALLRMMTGFSTWIGPPTYAGGYIFPAYVPSGAYFEVEVDVMPKGKSSPKETYSAIIWPTMGGKGDWFWKGQKPDPDSHIILYRDGVQVKSIDVQARPRGFGSPIDYNLRVRLVYDPSGANTLPATVKWVKNSIIDMYIYSHVTSSEAEAKGD